MESLEYGRPAEWAASQKWKRRGNSIKSFSTIAGLALLLAAGTALAFHLNFHNHWAGILIFTVFIALIAIYSYKLFIEGKNSWKRASQAKIGVKSEQQVRREVRKHKPPISMYGVQLGKRQGDCDLIIINKQRMLLAVEIKTGFGKVSMYGNQVRAGRKLMPRDPHGQTKKAAERVHNAVGVPVLPVLCVVEMENKPFMHQGVLICSAKDLFSAAQRYGKQSFPTMREAKAAAEYLWDLDRQAKM